MGELASNGFAAIEAEMNRRGVNSLLDGNTERRLHCHFPRNNADHLSWLGYGGTSPLSKNAWRCRIGSDLARVKQVAREHMI